MAQETIKMLNLFVACGDGDCVFFFPGSNTALHEFLHARNPKNQHSGTLESYLIKPIQVKRKKLFFTHLLLRIKRLIMLISQYSLPAYVTSYRVGMKLRFGVPNMKFALKYTCSEAMNC